MSDVSRPLYMPPLTNTPPTSSGPIRSRMNAPAPSLTRISDVVGEMRFVEQHHEHAVGAVVGLVGVLAGDRASRLVRHHVELLDLLRLAVLEDLEVLGAKARGEVAVPCRGRRRRLRRGPSTSETQAVPSRRAGSGRAGRLADGHQQERGDDGGEHEALGAHPDWVPGRVILPRRLGLRAPQAADTADITVSAIVRAHFARSRRIAHFCGFGTGLRPYTLSAIAPQRHGPSPVHSLLTRRVACDSVSSARPCWRCPW